MMITQALPRLWTSTPFHQARLTDADSINASIVAAYLALPAEAYSHRSHFIAGRFENLYLDRDQIPGLVEVLTFAEGVVRHVLQHPGPLRCGFWLNAMEAGHTTSEHTHEENDEILSGVYYVAAPRNSGDLVLRDGPLIVRLKPNPGTALFFPPAMPHWVEANQSPGLRLSIGMNFGPAE
jgi:ectoine hydroxylase-related dioxygenase (phytanoyl-CoA dioxygenase family)